MNNLISPNRSLLVFDRVTVSYSSKGNRTVILNEFNLDLEPGKFLAVIGPSGCGKTTLLNTAAGFVKPDSGTIKIGGQLIVEPSLQVGFVTQNYALFEWLTVEENIAFGLKSQKLSTPEIRHKVDHLLDVIELGPQRKHFPAQLSGGMQQRVALARSIAPKPKVLLLDEPFSALDNQTKKKMHELLLRLWKEHSTTILFVTHDVEEAVLLADSVLMLKKDIGIIGAAEIPFVRPRPYSLLHTKEFQEMVEKITTHYLPLS